MHFISGIFRLLPLVGMLACTADGKLRDASETGDNGPCFASDTAPALIETETIHVLETAEVKDADGAVISPAVYRSETSQKIVRERKEIRFETPCNLDTSPVFVATLQRSLKARGYLVGEVTGRMDEPTRQAILSYQSAQGLNSNILSLNSARELGLVAYDRDSY